MWITLDSNGKSHIQRRSHRILEKVPFLRFQNLLMILFFYYYRITVHNKFFFWRGYLVYKDWMVWFIYAKNNVKRFVIIYVTIQIYFFSFPLSTCCIPELKHLLNHLSHIYNLFHFFLTLFNFLIKSFINF